MSLYEYAPLDHSKNEIRILHLPRPNSNKEGNIHCTLQHVSLDELLPGYQLYLQERRPTTPDSAIRGWLKSYHADQSWIHPEVKSPAVDAWRYAAEYEDQTLVTNNTPLAADNIASVPPRFKWGDFEAISYCWGSDLCDKDVLVDEQVIRVTSNLEAMLQELQYLPEASSGMGFWVDGLCINQADIFEKNQQVSLMSRIYSQAMSTVVWLGPEASKSNMAIDKLHQSFGDCRVSYVDDSEANWTFHPGSGHHLPFPYWSPILDLCSREYFRRMWIIQEIALNKNMTMFLCGSRRFSRVHLQAACNSARTNAGAISRALGGIGLLDDCPVQIRHDFVWRTADDVYNLIKLRTSAKSMNQLLDLARKAKATDPRDKVYGMLGLLPREVAVQIEPDYSKTKEKAFIELATSILNCCQRLDELLSWSAFNEESMLPSWAPDWTFTHERRHLRRFRERKAGGEESPRWSLQRDGLGLCVRAVHVGQVKFSSLPTRSLLPYKVTEKSARPQACVDLPYGVYVDRVRLLLAFERTLMHGHPKRCEGGDLTDIPWTCWDSDSKDAFEWLPGVSDQWQYFDRFRQSNACFPIFGVAFKDFFTDIYVSNPILESFDDGSDRSLLHIDSSHVSRSRMISDKFANAHTSNLRRAAMALQHRRLITTQTGFLGLAPDEVKIGDTVAILLGCNYPVLLRPFEDGFKYVGECYIDGLMDGEAVEAAGRGEYQLEDIVLL